MCTERFSLKNLSLRTLRNYCCKLLDLLLDVFHSKGTIVTQTALCLKVISEKKATKTFQNTLFVKTTINVLQV